jgi:hypothetical protein
MLKSRMPPKSCTAVGDPNPAVLESILKALMQQAKGNSQ